MSNRNASKPNEGKSTDFEFPLRWRWSLGVILIIMSVAFFPIAKGNKKTKSTETAAPAKVLQDRGPVTVPVANEVCFSPDEPCDQKLIQFISTAKKSLDVAIYDVNLDQLVHQLALKSQSIPVRVVVDQRQSKGSHSLVSTLVKSGVSVRYGHQRGIMHDKFVIVDGTKIETGSFNYTNHASTANQENQVYLSTPEVVARYRTRFGQIWDDARTVDSKSLGKLSAGDKDWSEQ